MAINLTNGLGDLKNSTELRKSTEIKIFTYDPYAYPPNFQLAEDHMIATRIAKPIDKKGSVIDIDEATGLPVENEILPLLCDPKEISFISPGYPMYFQFLSFCAVICFTMFGTSGLYNLYSNYNGESCYDLAEIPRPVTKEFFNVECIRDQVNLFTLANKRLDDFSMDTQEIFNLGTVILLIALMQYLRKIQRETALLCDEKIISASDFTARVSNMPLVYPKGTSMAEDIKIFFRYKALPGRILNVQKVNLCYDVSEKLELSEEIEELILEKKMLENVVGKEDKLRKVYKELEEKKQDMTKINRKYQIGDVELFRGECFVTFETQEELQAVLHHWNLTAFQRLSEEIKRESYFKYRDQVLKITQAGEPSDILWENVKYHRKSKRNRRVVTAIGSIVILTFSFILIYLTKVYKKKMKRFFMAKTPDEEDNDLAIWIVTNLASYLIIFIDYLLEYVFEKFTEYEKHNTTSEHLTYMSARLGFAEFFNTSIIILVLGIQSGNIWGIGGLTTTIHYLFINTTIVGIWLGISDQDYYLSALERTWYRIRGKADMLQKDLNQLFEYPEFTFSDRYAFYFKIICSAAFYAPLVPLVLVWAGVYFVAIYWIDKFQMLRRRSRGKAVGSELLIEFMEFLEYPIILFAAGNLFFNILAVEADFSELYITIVAFAIGVLHAALPMQKFNESYFPLRDEITTNDTYSQLKDTFLEDYERSNPATSDIEIEKFALLKQTASIRKSTP